MKKRPVAAIYILRTIPVLVSALMIAILAGPVAASSPGERDDPKQPPSEAENTDLDTEYFVTEAAVTKISVDRETGEMTVVRPGERTRVLSAPLAAALSRSTEGLRVFEISGGGKGVHLEGRFQHVLIVRMKPDGSLQTVCSNHRHEAENHDHNKPVGGDTEPRDR